MNIFNKKPNTFKEYMRVSPNNTGVEHMNIQKKFLNKYINYFIELPRDSKTISLEVETLCYMRDSSIVNYEDLTVKEINEIISNGGSIIEKFITNAYYAISKNANNVNSKDSSTSFKEIFETNKKILHLEKVVNLLKNL